MTVIQSDHGQGVLDLVRSTPSTWSTSGEREERYAFTSRLDGGTMEINPVDRSTLDFPAFGICIN